MFDIVNRLKKMRHEMNLRYQDLILNAIAWLPVLVIGLAAFWISTSVEPAGTLADMRIKLPMYLGKSMIAVYIGELLWSILFPSLDGKKLMEPNIDEIPAKNYNIMYGRLIMHAIMQMVILNV